MRGVWLVQLPNQRTMFNTLKGITEIQNILKGVEIIREDGFHCHLQYIKVSNTFSIKHCD